MELATEGAQWCKSRRRDYDSDLVKTFLERGSDSTKEEDSRREGRSKIEKRLVRTRLKRMREEEWIPDLQAMRIVGFASCSFLGCWSLGYRC